MAVLKAVFWLSVTASVQAAFGAEQRPAGLSPQDSPTLSSNASRQCLYKYRRLATHSACQPASTGSKPLAVATEDRKLIVDTHNRYRSDVAPTATNMLRMSWDDEIAMIAQAWSETCSLEHDEPKNRDIPGRLSLGQNIGDGFQSWRGVIDAWFAEVKDFTYNGSHNVLEKVGHYTQGVWADSSKLGCGAADCGGVIFYVCNYGPAGNIDTASSRPYLSGPPCSTCPLHCHRNLCDCGQQGCENGGTMERETCQCQCQHPWLLQPHCKLNCSLVDEAYYCGRSPYDRDGCDVYENVPHDCPNTCHVCPYGEERYEAGDVQQPNVHNNSNSNDNNNVGNDENKTSGCCMAGPFVVVLLLSLIVST